MIRYLSAFVLLLTSAFQSSAQKFNWVKHVGSDLTSSHGITLPSLEHTKYLCTDVNKNLYAASLVGDSLLTADTFYRAHSIGPNPLNFSSTLLTSYSCEGKMRWARLIESSGEVVNYGLLYQAGSIYVAGRFGDTGTNRYRYVAGIPLTGHDSQFYFLARYDTLGNLKWMTFIGANDQRFVVQPSANGRVYGMDDNSLALDGQGNLHYIIYFKSGIKITPTLTTQAGTYDVRFDTTGVQMGAIRLGVDSTYYLYDHTAIINSRSRNTVSIGKKSGKIYTVMNKMTQGSPYIWSEYRLCAFSPGGLLLWEDTLTRFPQTANSKNVARIRDAVYDEGNAIYVSGEGVFGQFALNGVKTTYPGKIGLPLTAIIKVDTNGKPVWIYANEYWGLGVGYGYGFGELAGTTLLPNGNIISIGYSYGGVNHYKDSISYPTYFGKTGFTGGPFYTIVKPNGDLVRMGAGFKYGMHSPSGNSGDNFVSATADKAGNIYFGGMQSTDTMLLPGGIYNTKLNGPSNQDGFIARMGIDCRCNAFAHAAFKDSVPNEKTVYFTYTGTTEDVDSVVWYFGSGQKKKFITGFTTPFIRNYSSGAAYNSDSVLVIVYSRCGVDSAYRYPPTLPPLTVSSVTNADALHVFPNPTHTGTFKIVLESPSTIRQAEISLSDITGRQVYQKIIQPNGGSIEEEISVPQAAHGVYILEVRAGNERMVRRVIVE